MLLHTKPRRFSIATLTKTLADARGAIDLASIMVGVLVIGIIGAVIAATVFAVVPWSQDEAAKQSLDSVQTAQEAAYVLTEPNRYYDEPSLVGQGLLPDSDTITIGTDTDGTCYVAVAKSSTGKHYWVDQSGPTVHEYTVGATSDNCSVVIGDLVDTPSDPGGWPGDIDVPVYTAAYCATGDLYGGAISAAPAPAAYTINNGAVYGTTEVWDSELSAWLGVVGPAATPTTVTSWSEWNNGPLGTIDQVRAWIGDTEVSISQTGWSGVSVEGNVVFVENGSFTVGDGLNSTAREFNRNGTISFVIGGVTNSFKIPALYGDEHLSVAHDSGDDYCWPEIAPAKAGYIDSWSLTAAFLVQGEFEAADVTSMPIMSDPTVLTTWGWSGAVTDYEILLEDGTLIAMADGEAPGLFGIVNPSGASDDADTVLGYTINLNFGDEVVGLDGADTNGAIITFVVDGTVNQMKISNSLAPQFGAYAV